VIRPQSVYLREKKIPPEERFLGLGEMKMDSIDGNDVALGFFGKASPASYLFSPYVLVLFFLHFCLGFCFGLPFVLICMTGVDR
jgi:hypothetical protein